MPCDCPRSTPGHANDRDPREDETPRSSTSPAARPTRRSPSARASRRAGPAGRRRHRRAARRGHLVGHERQPHRRCSRPQPSRGQPTAARSGRHGADRRPTACPAPTPASCRRPIRRPPRCSPTRRTVHAAGPATNPYYFAHRGVRRQRALPAAAMPRLPKRAARRAAVVPGDGAASDFASRIGGVGGGPARPRRMSNPATTVTQGTMIPAILETAINTDVPGYRPRRGEPGRAQLRRQPRAGPALEPPDRPVPVRPAGGPEARLCHLDAADPARWRLGRPRLARRPVSTARPALRARSTAISSSASARPCCCR